VLASVELAAEVDPVQAANSIPATTNRKGADAFLTIDSISFAA
jgi:hypothetical protein